MYDLGKLITDKTQYRSGYTPPPGEDRYVISASMVANDMLQNYLTLVYKKVPEDHISDATLGTIFHKGMEQIIYESLNEPPMWAETSMHTILSNDWVLSGTADLIVMPEPGIFEIRDYKLTKNYTLKMMKKNMDMHSYTKQLQVLEALWRETGAAGYEIVGNITLVCDYFMKDSKAPEYEPVHKPTQVPNKIGSEDMNSTEVTFGEVVAITDSLQTYIESGQMPGECQDTWVRNVKGRTVHTRCEFYCGHSAVCPYHAKRGSDIMKMQSKIDW